MARESRRSRWVLRRFMGFTPAGRPRWLKVRKKHEDHEEEGPALGSPLPYIEDPEE